MGSAPWTHAESQIYNVTHCYCTGMWRSRDGILTQLRPVRRTFGDDVAPSPESLPPLLPLQLPVPHTFNIFNYYWFHKLELYKNTFRSQDVFFIAEYELKMANFGRVSAAVFEYRLKAIFSGQIRSNSATSDLATLSKTSGWQTGSQGKSRPRRGQV